MYAQFQSTVTPAVDGQNAELRITQNRELMVVGTADAGIAAAIGTTADPAVANGTINTVAATQIAELKAQLIALQAILAAAIDTTPVAIADSYAGEYETVAASQTAQVLGATGATGDKIKRLIIVPATVAPGQVLLLDNATSITIYVGGTVSAALEPIVVNLDMVSVSGAWKVTTGANVSVIGVGNFT